MTLIYTLPQVVVDVSTQQFDAVTMPFSIYKKMFHSDLTEQGISQFDEQWGKYLANNNE